MRVLIKDYFINNKLIDRKKDNITKQHFNKKNNF